MENLKPQLIQPDQTSPFGFTDTEAANPFASFSLPTVQTTRTRPQQNPFTRTRTRTRVPALSTATPVFGGSPSGTRTMSRSSIPMATSANSDSLHPSSTLSTSTPSAISSSGAAAGIVPGEQSTTAKNSSSGGMSGGEIAAAVVVPVVVVIAAVGLLVFFLIRRRKRTRLASYASNEPRSPTGYTAQMSQAPQLPPLVIPPKAIPTGSQFGTGSNTLQNSPQMRPVPMPTLPEKYNTTVMTTHASSGASSVHRDPFETPVGSEERRNGYLDAEEISPVNEFEHRISTIAEVNTQRGADEMSAVSDLSYQDEDVAEVNVAQRASVIHMGTGSGNSPRGSTGHAVTPR